MANKMLRPLAATFVILGVGGGAMVACSDDKPAANEPDAGLVDAGPQPQPDGGTDTPDAGPEEHTVDIGAGFSTACALSNLGHVKCWGDSSHGDMLRTDLEPRVCDDVLAGTVDCTYLPPTDLPIPYPVEQLAVGDRNVCVIVNVNGHRSLGCWGDQLDGMRFSVYGPPPAPDHPPPPAPPVPTVKVTSMISILLPDEPQRISAEDFFMVAELTDGTLWAWGDNQFGQYAGEVLEPEQAVPTRVWPATAGDALGAGPIVDMTTGFGSTFVLTANGLYGTGDNLLRLQMQPYPRFPGDPEEGELLRNNTWTRLPDARNGVDGSPLVQDPGADPIAKLWRNNGFSGTACYLTVSGKVYCWGSNESGQIGTAAIESGVNTFAQVPTRVDLPVGRTATQVQVASTRACAITDDGAVYCWGDNTNGPLADPPVGSLDPTPQLVAGVSDAKVIAIGVFFACALTGDHKTYCWGDNGYGQRGIDPGDGGGSQFGNTPTEVPLVW